MDTFGRAAGGHGFQGAVTAAVVMKLSDDGWKTHTEGATVKGHDATNIDWATPAPSSTPRFDYSETITDTATITKTVSFEAGVETPSTATASRACRSSAGS